MTIWPLCVACWITNTDTHAEYAIIISFPRQQWLSEGVSVIRYTYIACLVIEKKGL